MAKNKKTKFEYGDVVIYYSNDKNYEKKMHAQFYVGDGYRKNAEGYTSKIHTVDTYECMTGWACDRLNNYGSTSGFVYGNDKYKQNNWNLYIFRAPRMKEDGSIYA